MATIYLHPTVNTPQAVEAVQRATGCIAKAEGENRIVLVPEIVRVIDYINNN